MLAWKFAAVPVTPDFLFEIKWDGARAGVRVDSHGIQLRSRHGTDMTSWFPELAAIRERLDATSVLLDGEIIARDGSVESFNELLVRIRKRGNGAGSLPLTFVAFDVLEHEGRDVRADPLEDRLELVRSVITEGPGIAISRTFEDGPGLYTIAVASGLEGVVGKRRGSPYAAGRSRDWIKVKAPDAAGRHEWSSVTQVRQPIDDSKGTAR
jgi:bifunctional non-homologous end joining protein LigD